MKQKIYLDDVRTPIDKSWIVVRDYDEFVEKVEEIGLENIDCISLDHDLGPAAMAEYFNHTEENGEIRYEKITEKTGKDCAQWLVDKWLDNSDHVVQVYVHSANPIGTINIQKTIDGFYKSISSAYKCKKVNIPHTVKWFNNE